MIFWKSTPSESLCHDKHPFSIRSYMRISKVVQLTKSINDDKQIIGIILVEYDANPFINYKINLV